MEAIARNYLALLSNAWVGASDNSHEKIFGLAASADRKINPDTGFFKPVGHTVNISAARYENS